MLTSDLSENAVEPINNQQPSLRIHLLGAPEVWHKDGPAKDLGTKPYALLFYLAATRQAQMRTTLATLLWGEVAETRARANLRKVLQQLRALFGEHLRIDRHSVTLLESNCWVDVWDFLADATDGPNPDIAALQSAVSCYKGDFLSGFQVRNADDFETWLIAKRAKLRDALVSKLTALSALHRQQNGPMQAAQIARRIVALEPWNEEAHRQLIRLIADSGNLSAALEQYEKSREMLRHELDVEPDAETTRLIASIRDGSYQPPNSSLNGTGPIQPKVEFRTQKQIATTVDYRLTGRDAEWQILSGLWGAMKGPHMVCIGGESGIGKTRLAEELLVQAEQADLPTAHTRCHSLEGQLAYSPIADWLRTPTINPSLALLEEPWLTEISRLLPELQHEHPNLPKPEPLKESWQRKRFFDALLHAFTACQLPLLLVLDDLQWCDGDTLEWIQYLVESSNRPILVVGTVRTDEIDDDHPLRPVRQQLVHQSKYSEIPLNPLGKAAVTSLVDQVARPGHLNDKFATLFADTAGNPLFVIESVRATENRSAQTIPTLANGTDQDLSHRQVAIPPKMYGVIKSRLDQLSGKSQRIVQLGATIGRSFDVALLVQATQLDEETVYNQLDELWQRKLIRQVDGMRFDFSHDRIRDVAYAEIGPVRRPLLHKKVAVALESVRADSLDALYGQLATHYEYAGLSTEAIEYYQKAAVEGQKLYAHKRVLNNHQAALTLLRRLPKNTQNRRLEIDLLGEIGHDYQNLSGLGHELCGQAWCEAYELSLESGSLEQNAIASVRMSAFHRHKSRWKDSHRFALQASIKAKRSDSPHPISQANFALAVAHTHLANFDQARIAFEKIMEMRPEQKNRLHADLGSSTAVKYGHVLWFMGYPDQAKNWSFKALDQSRKSESSLPMFCNLVSMTMIFLRDSSTLKKLNPEHIDASMRQNSPFFLRCANMYKGWLMAHQGIQHDCVGLIRENSDLHRERGNLIFDVFYRSLLVESYLLKPDPELALDELEGLLEFAEETGNRYWNAQLLKLKGDSLAALLFPEAEVEACYQEAIDTAHQQQGKSLELRATVSLARLWQKQGRADDAHRLLSEIYGWFTEGFDTADLTEAKALLQELGAKEK